jgi:uncharacterized protein
MDVTPLVKQGQNIVQSYGNGQIKISGQFFDKPVVLRPDAIGNWNVSSFDELNADHFSGFKDDEVVLLGCGERIQFLPPTLRNTLKSQRITVDVMDTGAACRTYNMLLSDGRNVVAAFFPF